MNPTPKRKWPPWLSPRKAADSRNTLQFKHRASSSRIPNPIPLNARQRSNRKQNRLSGFVSQSGKPTFSGNPHRAFYRASEPHDHD